MGGNRYTNRLSLSDYEIDQLYSKYEIQENKLKSLFNDRVYKTFRGWVTGASYNLDKLSLEKLLFKITIEEGCFCHNCSTRLGLDSYAYGKMSRYCKECADNKVWTFKENINPEKLKNRGRSISAAKIEFYGTDKGKNLAKDNGRRISKSLLAHFQSDAGLKQISDTAEKCSIKMKEKILQGNFTPNSNNRNTNWDSNYNGKKYRSSWEALYHYYNPGAEYEKLRIEYSFNSKNHIYIVDFVDHNKRIATEVKPREMLHNERDSAKLDALSIWCKKFNYQLQIADRAFLLKYGIPEDLNKFSQETIKKIKEFYKA